METRTAALLSSLTEDDMEKTAATIVAEKKTMDEAEFFATVSACIVTSAVAPEAQTKLYVQIVLSMQSSLDEKTMKRALLTAIQTKYNAIWERDTVKYIGCDDAESQDQPMILGEYKVEWLGFMEFLGLLYVNGLVPEVVLRSVLDRFAELRGNPDENLVEGICQLLLTDGVVYKLFSTKRGEGFITGWKGLASLTEFKKKKTKYLDLKSTFDLIVALVENKGKAPRKAGKSPAHTAAVEAPHHQDGGGRGPGKASRSADHDVVDRFATLKEDLPDRRNKGDGKGYSRGGRGDKGGEKGGDPQMPDPRQVFVAGIGSSAEDEIKAFFQQAGDVDRVKVLRTPEGDSRDVCFITFRSEDQAQKALTLHGASFAGRNLTVRIANGKKGNEKGNEKGGGKAGGKDGTPGSPPSPSQGFVDVPGSPPDLGGSSRFDALAGQADPLADIGGLPPPRSKGKGTAKGGKGKTEWIAELDAALEEEIEKVDSPVKVTDFDFTAKRFLSDLRGRDRSDNTTRFQGAVGFVLEYTAGKDRSAVRKWSAYVFTLLQKYDPDFADDFKRRDEERRRQPDFVRREEDG